MNTFAIRLKELRTRRHISQDTLSRFLGVSRSTIGLYEQGRREPDFETLEAIADFFNVPIGTLVDKDPQSYPRRDPIDTYDDELVEELQRLHDDPELRMLLSATKNLTKEDVRFMADLARRMHAGENRDE